MSNDRKRANRLGRGLSSLMGTPVEVPVETTESTPREPAASEPVVPRGTEQPRDEEPDGAAVSAAIEGFVMIPVDSITPNPHQPRQDFDDAALGRLADSIRERGLMQPVVVRPETSSGSADPAGRYALIAGERRWRAAQRAGLTALPAMVREVDDQAAAELALVENLQREDLNPIERAEAFQRLTDEFELSHDEVAGQVGLERSTVSNLLRLLKLSPPCRQMVRDGLLSMGQARALAGVAEPGQQHALAERTVREGLTVRAVEQAVRLLNEGNGEAPTTTRPASAPRPASPHLADLERQLAEHLGTKVAIKPGRKKHTGTLRIDYFDNDQFEKLLEQLGVELN